MLLKWDLISRGERKTRLRLQWFATEGLVVVANDFADELAWKCQRTVYFVRCGI